MNLHGKFKTYSELRQEILESYDGSSDDLGLVAVIENSIKDNLFNYWFQAGDKFGAQISKGFKISLEKDRRAYPLPPRFAGHYDARLYVDNTGDSQKLLYMPWRDFLMKYSDESSGDPEFFSVYGEEIIFGPAPATDGDWIELDYACYAEEPISDDDLIMIPQQYIKPLKMAIAGDVNIYQSKDSVGLEMSDRGDKLFERVSGIDHRRKNGGYTKMQIGITKYSNFRQR